MATITVLPLYWLVRLAVPSLQWMIAIALVAISILSAQLVAIDRDLDDPQIVVIDEVCGAFVALALADCVAIMPELAALFLFRVFDIFKPWPINISFGRHAGFDIVYDDMVSGLCAGGIIRLCMWLVH
jgi:phosphatidylglycerophosphatase A